MEIYVFLAPKYQSKYLSGWSHSAFWFMFIEAPFRHFKCHKIPAFCAESLVIAKRKLMEELWTPPSLPHWKYFFPTCSPLPGDAGAPCQQPLLWAGIVGSKPVGSSEEHGDRWHREEAAQARRRQAQVPAASVLSAHLWLLRCRQHGRDQAHRGRAGGEELLGRSERWQDPTEGESARNENTSGRPEVDQRAMDSQQPVSTRIYQMWQKMWAQSAQWAKTQAWKIWERASTILSDLSVLSQSKRRATALGIFSGSREASTCSDTKKSFSQRAALW